MEFLNQKILYLIFLPIFLFIILIFSKKGSVQTYFTKDIMEKLRVETSFLSKKSRNILLFITLILFIIALARPVIDKKEQNIQQSLIPIVIALDVSTSMLAEDIYPNRISLAKKKLQEIIKIAKNTTVGVVLFAKDSFILSPVTEDFISLKYIVDNLDTKLDFVNGSNIFSTLEATKYMLSDYNVKNLIFLSDGGNIEDFSDELEFLKENNIVVYSIGMATKEGAPIPQNGSYLTNTSGDIVRVSLNDSIKNISLKSAGGYIDFTLDNEDVNAIINRINAQSKKEELNIQKVKVYTELFYYPLALGLFLFLITLSSLPQKKNKSNLHSILFISFMMSTYFFPSNVMAYTFNFENIEKAKEAYESKDYKTSSQLYKEVTNNNESLYNLGNSLYKESKYKEAIDVYNKIKTDNPELESKRLHNLGNSYVNMNDLKKAKEFYEKSLDIKEDKETQENLDLVNKELDKKQEENKKDNNQNEDNKKQDQQNQDQQNKENQDQQNKENQDQQNKEKQEKQNKESQEQKNKDDQKKSENDSNSKDENKQKNDSQKKEKQDKNQNKSEKEKNKKEDDLKSQDESNKDEGEASPSTNSQIKKDELSDMEEKKWMNMLKENGSPLYMQKVQTQKESNYDKNQPW